MDEPMSLETMEFMVWIIEIAAREFFCGNKTTAYDALKSSGIWELYTEHYDVTHTLGSEYLLEEMRERFNKCGVSISC